jgi:hypothetical protein
MSHTLRNGCLALLLCSCGSSVQDLPTPQCLKLALPGEGLTTATPARVSLFFTVDTCEGKPVSGLTADQFTLFEDGNAVSAYESQKTVQPKGQRFRMSSLLLLDISGSWASGETGSGWRSTPSTAARRPRRWSSSPRIPLR